jgi:hypothetical protein
MIKTFLRRTVWGELILAGAFSCLFALSASAQNAGSTTQITPGTTATAPPTKGIGPAPANTKQGKILDGALSSQTRQTLQEAMNSVPAK